MTDLGIYNFVKNALAQGKTKDSIKTTLLAQGMSQNDIDAMLASVENGAVPVSQSPSSFTKFNSKVNTQGLSTISELDQWYSFRNSFWKYFIIALIISAVSEVLKIGVIYLAVNFVLLFLIAGQVGKITSEIRGKKSWALMILGFFLPPAAFYFVYRMEKQHGLNISLNILEGIIVIVGMVLYVLWVLAVGGIIIAIILASRTTRTVNGFGTYGPSTDKNVVLRETQSNLGALQANAELYYDRSRNSYGSSTDCFTSGMFTDPKISQSIKDVSSYTGFSPTCGSNGQQYAVQVKIKDLAYFCVDSKGKSGLDSTQIPNNTFVCP